MTGSARDIENGEKIQYNTCDKFLKVGVACWEVFYDGNETRSNANTGESAGG